MFEWLLRILDLVGTSGNVEDDILLRRGDCDAPKEGGFSFYIDLGWTSEGAQLLILEKKKEFWKSERGQIRPDTWPDCLAVLKKKRSLATASNPAGFWRGSPAANFWPAVFFIYILFWLGNIFISSPGLTELHKREKLSIFLVSIFTKSCDFTDGFGKYFIQGCTMVVWSFWWIDFGWEALSW